MFKNQYTPEECDIPDCVECEDEHCKQSFWCDNEIIYAPFCHEDPEWDCGDEDIPMCIECEDKDDCETVFACKNQFDRISWI